MRIKLHFVSSLGSIGPQSHHVYDGATVLIPRRFLWNRAVSLTPPWFLCVRFSYTKTKEIPLPYFLPIVVGRRDGFTKALVWFGWVGFGFMAHQPLLVFQCQTLFLYISNIWFVKFCRYTQLNDQTVLFLTIQFNIVICLHSV